MRWQCWAVSVALWPVTELVCLCVQQWAAYCQQRLCSGAVYGCVCGHMCVCVCAWVSVSVCAC